MWILKKWMLSVHRKELSILNAVGVFKEHIKQNIIILVLRKVNSHLVFIGRLLKKPIIYQVEKLIETLIFPSYLVLLSFNKKEYYVVHIIDLFFVQKRLKQVDNFDRIPKESTHLQRVPPHSSFPLTLWLSPFSFLPYNVFKLPYFFHPLSNINITTLSRQHTQFLPTPSLFISPQAKLTPKARRPPTYQQQLLTCTLPKSLTNSQASLLGPYNQDIKVWITTKYIKKRRQALHEIPTQERRNSIKGVFLIHPPPLFLVLTHKIKYQYRRLQLT